MIDDIIEELRDWADIVREAKKNNVHVQMLDLSICDTAANIIEMLQDAGNALAISYRTLGGLDVAHDVALRCWEEINDCGPNEE